MYQFKANGGFGVMHQATKRLNESGRIHTFTNKFGKTFKMDPEAAKIVATSGGVNRAHPGYEFTQELLSSLLDNFTAKEANILLSKLMTAISQGNFPYDIKVSKDGSLDKRTQDWLS